MSDYSQGAPMTDLTKIEGYEPPPPVPDDRIMVSQRLAVQFWGDEVRQSFGAWDWGCKICHAGNGALPIGRDSVVPAALEHLRSSAHGEVLILAADFLESTGGPVVSAPLISADEAKIPQPLRMKSRYTIPGLDGTWKLMGLRTTNMAEDGRASLDMIRESTGGPE